MALQKHSGKFLLFLGIAPCCCNLTGLTWFAQRDARLGSYRPVAALAITRVPQKPHNFGDMIAVGNSSNTVDSRFSVTFVSLGFLLFILK